MEAMLDESKSGIVKELLEDRMQYVQAFYQLSMFEVVGFVFGNNI